MKEIKVIIERAKDGTFSAYGLKVDGIWGMGETAAAAKESALESIRLLKAYNDPIYIPSILKCKYQLVFRFDTESLLNYYKGVFTKSALERLTGINQQQLHHYAKGLKKPRAAQSNKIQKALHQLGEELLSVEL